MKWSATLRLPRINLAVYRQQLHEHLTRALTDATVEWLGATNTLIPVWSGASIATFVPLASLVNFELQGGPNTSSPGTPDRTSLGLGSGTGDFSADADAGQYHFTYSTTLAHLIFNEFNDANSHGFHLHFPGPYQFQLAGLAAFNKFAATVRLPDPMASITIKTITV